VFRREIRFTTQQKEIAPLSDCKSHCLGVGIQEPRFSTTSSLQTFLNLRLAPYSRHLRAFKMAPGLLSDVHTDSESIGELEPLCQIITPIGMLGYGFDELLTRKALQDLQSLATPTALILDSGSTDAGPLKLAVGSMTAPRMSYERDFRKLLALGHEFKVPIIISSAGGDGSDAHVNEFLEIIQEISEAETNR